MEKRVIGLIRVSTTSQELESQKNDLLKYILSKGYTEDEVIWLEFKGASANLRLNEVSDIRLRITYSTARASLAIQSIQLLNVL